MGDGWSIDSRKPHISNATGLEVCTYHVQKAALANSASLFSVHFGRIELSTREGIKTYLVDQMSELRNSMVCLQLRLEVRRGLLLPALSRSVALTAGLK